MKITIVGAGRVGVHLAKYFAYEQQDVFLVDTNSDRLATLETDFNLRTCCGEPTDFETLREAGSEKADMFVAVTGNAAENLVACAMAKSMGAAKTIARVDRHNYMLPANEAVVRKMGVDFVVFPDYLAASSIVQSLENAWAKDWSEFEDGSIVMVAAEVTEESPVNGLKLKDFAEYSSELHVSALRRNHRTLIPHGDDAIVAGDILYFTAVPEAVKKMQHLLGIKDVPIKKVILLGGSLVSELVVNMSANRFSYVIIERNKERCRELMVRCPACDIICGDASEFDVLEEAGIRNCDAVVALTDNTESNILSCLTARDLGVRKDIAEVEKEQLIDKAESFRLDTIINKPIITANAIFQIILDANADSSKCFVLPDADVGRITVKEGSFLTRGRVMDLKLPEELTLAGRIHNGKGEMVTGRSCFEPGDVAIVFCLSGALKRVEKLFGK